MKHVTFYPQGVCSVQIDYDLDDQMRIHNLQYVRGCNGRGTSCADQLSKSLDQELGK